MHRFYQKIALQTGQDFEIDDSNIAHQIGHVLRMRVGDKIIVFNGSGVDFLSEIVTVDKRCVACRVVEENRVDAERSIRVNLYQAIPHTWSKFEDVLKKCTELGVTDFYPLLLDRCETRLKDGEESPKEERLHKIIIEACEQCGASVLPQIHNVCGLKNALKQSRGIKIMAYEGEKNRTLENLNIREVGEVSLFIGPEGGITEEEAVLFEDSGGFLFNLGKRILRTETAPVAVVGRIVL